jgi:CO/xanthine dehydrogenase Mo-binding subunit
VEGQIQGATTQGIGWALNEEYFYTNDGLMANSTFLDYRMPTTLDVPMIDAQIVEVPNPRHPYGLRGVGEIPIIAPLAALSNAIYDANWRPLDQAADVTWGHPGSAGGQVIGALLAAPRLFAG